MASWQDRVALQQILVQLRRLSGLTASLNVLPNGGGLLLNGDLLVDGNVNSMNLPPYNSMKVVKSSNQTSGVVENLFDTSYSFAILTLVSGDLSLNGSNLVTSTPYSFNDLSNPGEFQTEEGYSIEIAYFKSAPSEPPLGSWSFVVGPTNVGEIEAHASGVSDDCDFELQNVPTGATSATASLTSLISVDGIEIDLSTVTFNGKPFSVSGEPVEITNLTDMSSFSIGNITNTTDEPIDGDFYTASILISYK